MATEDQVFIDGRPTRCDWGKEPIASTDNWMECDQWHLCQGCYDALMTGTSEDFKARYRAAA